MHRSSILIIDDARSVHDLIAAHLSDELYDVLSAFDGASGISTAAEGTPDLVLLDLDLPDIGGFDVCRHLKADQATSKIAVIFLTASNGFDERACGMDLDACDYVTKPFDPAELALRIRGALRVKRMLDLLPDDIRGIESPGATDAARPSHQLRMSFGDKGLNSHLNPWRIMPEGW